MKILYDPKCVFDREEFDMRKRKTIWAKRGKKWHLTIAVEDCYIDNVTAKGNKRRAEFKSREIYETYCGLHLHITRLSTTREFIPEKEEMCPLCRAFYEGLRYQGPKEEDKVKARWKGKTKSGERAWFDQ